MTIENPARYDFDARRDERWREIVGKFCLLPGTNEADDVVPRLLAAGVERVLEVGSHWGPVAERLSSRGVFTTCLELDSQVVRLAHKPAVQATAALLPFGIASFDAVTALNVLYFLERPEEAVEEAKRVLRKGGIFVACTQSRDNDPELKNVAPRWGEPSTFDGDNAEDIVRSVFTKVEIVRWDLPAYHLPTKKDIIDYIEVFYKISRAEAERRAAPIAGPLTITKKGLFVWATKDEDDA